MATTERPVWQNRIVGTGEEDPAQLLANPRNAWIHSQEQQEAMLAVLETVGWVQDVVVNRATGFLVDGHMRVVLALRHHQPAVPVKYVELTQDEEDLILAVFNEVARRAVPDKDLLGDLLDELAVPHPALQALLDDLAAAAGLTDAEDGERTPPPAADQPGQYTISPELYERHDYVLLYCDNAFDWQVLCQYLDIQQVRTGQVARKTIVQKGQGRVVPARRLLDKVGL